MCCIRFEIVFDFFHQFYNRYFDTDEKIVYMSGRLPHTFVENFETMSSSSSTSKKGRLMYSYHTHRDMMYSFAEFFNLQFDGPGILSYTEVLMYNVWQF